MAGAIIFCVALAGFLAGCLIAAILTDGSGYATGSRAHLPCSGNGERQPRRGVCAGDNTFGDAADGDWPFIAANDLETLFHANRNTQGGRPDHAA